MMNALAGDVGSAAVDRFEHRRLIAEIRSRHHAQPADHPRAQIAYHIPVEILHEQHIDPARILHQLHAAGVDDQLVVFDVRIFLLEYLARAIEEQAVRHLHDVGLMKDGDFLAMPAGGVAEGEAGDAHARIFGGDLDAGDDAGDDFVFDAAIEAFGIFTNDDQIDVVEARLDAGEISHRPDGGIQVQLLAKLHIDGLKPLADRRSDRPFEADLMLLNGGERALRENTAFRFDA
jgi:hypothetical protein